MLLLSCKKKRGPFRSKTYCEKNLVTAAFGTVPRSTAPGGWLLPRPCGWWLPFDLRPLAVGCGPSYCCPWQLAAAPGGSMLLLRPAAPGGSSCCPWRLDAAPSSCCPWQLDAAPSSCCPWRLDTAPSCCPWRLDTAPWSAAPGGWLLPRLCGYLLPLGLLHLAVGCCPSFFFQST